jgi:hypothetical protein
MSEGKSVLKTHIEQINKKVAEDEENVKGIGLFGQIRLLEPFLNTIKESRLGKAMILVVFMVGIALIFGLVIVLYYAGGISAALVGIIVVFILAVHFIVPLVEIQTVYPACIAIPQIFRRRIGDYTLNEGLAATIKYLFEFIQVYIGVVNLDFEAVVYDENNLEITLPVSISINADRNQILMFYDKGGAHGLVKNDEGKLGPKKEQVGDHGIADFIIDQIMSSLGNTAHSKPYNDIIGIDPGLANKALQRITENDKITADALSMANPHVVPGLGIQISNLAIKRGKPGKELEKIIARQGIELAEREFRITDVDTKKIQFQQLRGKGHMSVKEFDEYLDENPEERKALEDFYRILKAIEQQEEMLEKGQKIIPGSDVLLVRIGRLIENGGEVANLAKSFMKLTGGKDD